MTQVHCWIRTSPYALPMIFEAGRFKTQHETGSSLNASDDLDTRITRERGAHVVYGYLCGNERGAATHGHDLILMEYGEAAVRLRDSIKTRTTFTVADSLYQAVEPTAYSEDAVPANLDEILPYVEAQYVGGVSVQDIEEVVFQVWEGTRGFQPMMAFLDTVGVPYRVNIVPDR